MVNMDVKAMVQRLESRKKEDYVAPGKMISVSVCDADLPAVEMRLGDQYRFPMNGHAIDQLSSTVGPGFQTYGRWLLGQKRGNLYADNVNRSMENSDRKLQVRTLDRGDGQVARAVLSDMFKPIDDDIVYGAALPLIGEQSGRFKALGGNMTDTNSYLKIVTKEPVFSVNTGGKTRNFSAGFIMRNSEVGLGFCEFMAFLTDSYCENGCIFSKQVVAEAHYVHRGSRIRTDFGPILGDRLLQAELASIRAAIGEATSTALSEQGYDQMRELIVSSSQRRIATDDVAGLIEVVAQRVGLTKDEAEQVKVHFDASDPTQFGVQAAITSFARTVEDYDRGIALEAAGGQVASMGKAVWDSVNKLAAA